MYPRIGIRPVIDGRQFGVREDLEEQTMNMAYAAKNLIESNLRYPDGTKVECVIAPTTIGGGAEAYECETFFQTQNVCATLSVTPCWCYGSETMEKLMWGSDYPRTITAITYKMSYDFVVKSPELSEAEKTLFLGGNARKFYGFAELPELPYIKNMSE